MKSDPLNRSDELKRAHKLINLGVILIALLLPGIIAIIVMAAYADAGETNKYDLAISIVLACTILCATAGSKLIDKGQRIEREVSLPDKRSELTNSYRELCGKLMKLQNQLHDSSKLMSFLNIINQLETHDYKVESEISYFEKVGDRKITDLLTKFKKIIQKNRLETFFPFEEKKIKEARWNTEKLENILSEVLKLTEQISLYQFPEA